MFDIFGLLFVTWLYTDTTFRGTSALSSWVGGLQRSLQILLTDYQITSDCPRVPFGSALLFLDKEKSTYENLHTGLHFVCVSFWAPLAATGSLLLLESSSPSAGGEQTAGQQTKQRQNKVCGTAQCWYFPSCSSQGNNSLLLFLDFSWLVSTKHLELDILDDNWRVWWEDATKAVWSALHVIKMHIANVLAGVSTLDGRANSFNTSGIWY